MQRARRRLTRRTALTLAVQGAVALGLAACGSSTTQVSSGSQSAVSPSSPSASATAASSLATSKAAATTHATSSGSVSSATTVTRSAAGSATSAAAPVAAARPTPTINPNALQILGYGLTLGYTDATALWNTKNPSIPAQFTVGGYPAKFLTLAAAGTPPDVLMAPPAGDTLALVVKGTLRPLDGYAKTSHVSPDDFFLPAWNSQVYQGKVYALPNEVDPNNPLVLNMRPLKEVGIDKAPTTIQEVDDASAKLLQVKNGEVQRVGLEPPWNRWNAGRVAQVFDLFGGSFLDPKTHTSLNVLQPNDIDAMSWLKQFADLNGGYAALQAFLGKQNMLNKFPGKITTLVQGTVPMQTMVASQAAMVLQGMQKNGSADAFAITLPPHGPHGSSDPAWLGGWVFVLPTGTKRPDDAWKVTAWMCASPDGTDAWAEKNRFLPGYKKSTFYATNKNDVITQGFLKVLQGARYVSPNVGDAPNALFSTLLSDVSSGKAAVNSALETFQQGLAPYWAKVAQPEGAF